MTKRILCWFRRDLRLDDNTALLAAYAAAEEVVPVFIFDDAILSRPDTGALRVAFLLESLRNLDENLRARQPIDSPPRPAGAGAGTARDGNGRQRRLFQP
jgi:deoxyribodipyrimidine photolyase